MVGVAQLGGPSRGREEKRGQQVWGFRVTPGDGCGIDFKSLGVRQRPWRLTKPAKWCVFNISTLKFRGTLSTRRVPSQDDPHTAKTHLEQDPDAFEFYLWAPSQASYDSWCSQQNCFGTAAPVFVCWNEKLARMASSLMIFGVTCTGVFHPCLRTQI